MKNQVKVTRDEMQVHIMSHASRQTVIQSQIRIGVAILIVLQVISLLS